MCSGKIEKLSKSGQQNAPIAGVFCSGIYCDIKEVITIRDTDGFAAYNNNDEDKNEADIVVASNVWTPWFSEDVSALGGLKPNTSVRCPKDMVVNEIQCRGTYCGDVRLSCGKLAFGYELWNGDPTWTKDAWGYCRDGYYLTGMHCHRFDGKICVPTKLKCTKLYYVPVNMA